MVSTSGISGERGFTLIELLVVIAIIGILAAAAIPQVMDALCDSRAGAAKSEIGTIRTAFAQCQVSEDSCDSMSALETANVLPGSLEGDGNWTLNASGTTINKIKTSNVGCDWQNGNNGMKFDPQNGDYSDYS